MMPSLDFMTVETVLTYYDRAVLKNIEVFREDDQDDLSLLAVADYKEQLALGRKLMERLQGNAAYATRMIYGFDLVEDEVGLLCSAIFEYSLDPWDLRRSVESEAMKRYGQEMVALILDDMVKVENRLALLIEDDDEWICETESLGAWEFCI